MEIRRLYKPSRAQRDAIIALEAAWITGGKRLSDADFDDPNSAWWGVFEDAKLIAFASAVQQSDQAVMLTRAVTSRAARGRGVQRRLINLRVRWARARGATRCWTYTHCDNPRSAGNLNRCGFHYRGASDDRHWLYWRKPL